MSAIPIHIGIIMDGNGRWAQLRSRPRTFGHIKGTRVAKKIITRCADLGVERLTLYAFSTENWLRPEDEVSFLMGILRRYLKRETQNLVRKNIRFTTIGNIERLPSDLVAAIQGAEQATSNCTGLKLVFAVNYGSRQEMTEAIQAIALKAKNGELEPFEITAETVNMHLQTYPAKDPDLIIRTSGETRLSNFLLWQAAYSEFYFTKTLWPDFSEADLDEALASFMKRDRRYGRVSDHGRQLEN